jgi:hypothetical protein
MKYLVVSLSAIFSLSALAFDRYGFTIGGASDEQQIAIDSSRFWRLGDSKFFLGTGVRLTSQWSNGQTFKTAPAELTRGESGLGAIFRQEKTSNIDELTLGQSHITSLNILFQILYELDESWSVGFNIDVIGYSYGEVRSGRYNPRSDDAQWPSEVSARPSRFNLLLGDDNDRGSLNSELYLLRNISEKWAAKIGIVHAFTEYETKQRLRKENDRFRKKNFLPTLGFVRVF